jgi:hypothetical protein
MAICGILQNRKGVVEMTREQAVNFLIKKPYKLGHLLGFTKLLPLHNKWIISMIKGKKDKTLQASRG